MREETRQHLTEGGSNMQFTMNTRDDVARYWRYLRNNGKRDQAVHARIGHRAFHKHCTSRADCAYVK